MEHYRDERIVCVSCGNSFVFTASEAAIFAERGLSSPPKRCKECRRIRKEQMSGAPRSYSGAGYYDNDRGGGMMGGSGSYPRPPSQRSGNRPPRMPSHTGDVNEYRSPMQVNSQPSQSDYRNPMYADPRGQSDYRGPMQGGGPLPHGGRGPARGRPRGPRGAAVDDGNYRAPAFREGYGPPQGQGRQGSPPREPRAREMFTITCNACGAESQVPFRPDEGREVFCQACYRARKPA